MQILHTLAFKVQTMHPSPPFFALFEPKTDWHGNCIIHRRMRFNRGPRKERDMNKRTAGMAAASILVFGLLAAGPVAAAQDSTPCATPGAGPRDGSGQGQGLRDGKGNGPRNGQGYGPKRGRAQGLRDGRGNRQGQGKGQGKGRGLTRRDGSCVERQAQPTKEAATR